MPGKKCVYNLQSGDTKIPRMIQPLRVRFGFEAFAWVAFLMVLGFTSAWPDRASADWVRRYGYNRGGGLDKPSAIAVDKEGNVYVTGSSKASDSLGYGLVTAKYDKSGKVEWIVRHDGSEGSSERANAIAVDNAGNVYVTGGTSLNLGDYLTVKYDTHGVEKWVRTYDGPPSGTDKATAIVVDAAGGVYVTGHSDRIEGFASKGFLTLKYNAEGEKVWERRHREDDLAWDSKVLMALDPSGNVCITGTTRGCITIKYDSDGAMLWKQRFDGPSDSVDFVTALAVDTRGNIYLAGFTGAYYNPDFLTIKYNSKGVKQWVRCYNGPKRKSDRATAIAVDDRGHVYVTGASISAFDDSHAFCDYVTIKYGSDGAMLWQRSYDGAARADDQPSAISVDDGGNVYVTGYSELDRFYSDRIITTIKYDNRGVKLWVQHSDYSLSEDPSTVAMALDAKRNILITGAVGDAGLDFLTVKYDAKGTRIWQHRYDSPRDGMNEAKAIAVDDSGAVYVTGSSMGKTDWDFLTIKYNANGVMKWKRRHGDSAGDNDFARVMGLDAAGNVYVTGYSIDKLTEDRDYLTVKYDTNGTKIWKQRYNGLGNGDDVPTAMAVDAVGNVHVTGTSSDDFLTIKYDTNGSKLWEQSYDAGGPYGDCPKAIALDDKGNIYVTGDSNIGYNWDICTIKYDTNGEEIWKRRYDAGRFHEDTDSATGIAIDTTGNVYVSGCSGELGDQDYLTVKYGRDGRKIWQRFYDGRSKDQDCATAIAVDSLGSVYVTGQSIGPTHSKDFLTIKYDTHGKRLWVRSYDAGIRAGDDLPSSLALDADANVYITGYSEGSHAYYRKDFLTIKYDTNGVKVWERRYDGPVGGSDSATAIALDAMRNVYVTGASESFNYSDFLTIKYKQEQSQSSGPRVAGH